MSGRLRLVAAVLALALCGVALALVLRAFLAPPLEASSDAPATLPPGDGRELVTAHCTGCHGAGMLLQTRIDRAGWAGVLASMQHDEAAPRLEPGVRERILAYLSERLGPDSAAAWDGVGPRPVNPLP